MDNNHAIGVLQFSSEIQSHYQKQIYKLRRCKRKTVLNCKREKIPIRTTNIAIIEDYIKQLSFRIENNDRFTNIGKKRKTKIQKKWKINVVECDIQRNEIIISGSQRCDGKANDSLDKNTSEFHIANSESTQMHLPSSTNIRDVATDVNAGDSESTSCFSNEDDGDMVNQNRLHKNNATNYDYNKIPWSFGKPTFICEYCNALLWYEERTEKRRKVSKPRFPFCCLEGKVQLPFMREPPVLMKNLLNSNGGPRAIHFLQNIRMYNAIFAFTSMGGNVDQDVNNGGGPSVIRINGQNFHKIGSLEPPHGRKPTFAQLYTYDTENEITNRLHCFNKNDGNCIINSLLVDDLTKMLDECNVLVQFFRMARDRIRTDATINFRLRLISSKSQDGRYSNLPTASEIAALIVGDLDVH